MKSDGRVKYTKMVIKRSFLKLLGKKPVDKITVTELCDMAEINRATFYTHYKDCYDLLDSIQNDFLDEFRSTGRTDKWCDPRELISAIYDTISENIDICDALIFNAKNPTLLVKMLETAREYCIEKWKVAMPQLSDEERDLLFIHLSTGLAAVMFARFKSCERELLIGFMTETVENCLSPYQRQEYL